MIFCYKTLIEDIKSPVVNSLNNIGFDKTKYQRKKSNSSIIRKTSIADIFENCLLTYDVTHLSEINKNPLLKRNFTKSQQSSTSILLAWTHSFQTQNLSYVIEYGIGSKIYGVEQFRQGYKGTPHICIITDLMPRYTF